MKIIFAFGEKLERGRSPRSKMCHSEPNLRGVSNSIEGGERIPLKTPPFCHPERSEGSPQFSGGGKSPLLQIHPKNKRRRFLTSFEMTQ